MPRSAIKKNNQRLMTYRGDVRNKYGSKGYESIGVTLNMLNYYGDLSPAPERISTDLSLTKPGIGLLFSKKLTPAFSYRATFLYGTLSGSDHRSADMHDSSNGIFRYQRNLSFRNRVKELSLVAVIDFKSNNYFFTDRAKQTPYAFVGIAVFHHNPQAKVPSTDLNGNPFPNAGEWVSLRKFGTEGQFAQLSEEDANYGIQPYHRIQPAVPFGLGVRVRIGEQWDASAEIGFRYLFTDYIDDVSGNYVDLGVLKGDLAKALSYRTNEIVSPTYSYTSEKDGNIYSVVSGYGHEDIDSKRGNRSDNDFYTMISIQLSYIIQTAPSKRAKFR